MKNIYSMMIAFLLLLSCAFASSYYSMPDNYMQTWYDFNNSSGPMLKDLKSSANGLNTNTQQGLPGKIGLDYNYDGTTSHTLLDTSLMRDGNFSFSFWMKAYPQEQNPGFIFGRSGGATTNTSYTMGYYDGFLYFEMYSPATVGANANVTGITEDVWHLVVVSYRTDTNKVRINVDNGAKSGISAASLPTGPYFGSQNTYLGRDYRTTYRYKGMIDEFAYWTKYLSDTDINNLWNGGNGITYYSDAIDYITPSVGQTTINGFTYYGNTLNGTGNIIGGTAQNYIDYNFGSNWVTAKTNMTQVYNSVSTSSTGQYVYAVGVPGYIYDSNDYGVTWRQSDVNRTTWMSITSSSDGKYAAAVGTNTKIFLTSDYGNTWVEKDANRAWTSIKMNPTGQYISAVVSYGGVIDSNDYGATWTSSTLPGGYYLDFAMSDDGQYRYAVSGTKTAAGTACNPNPKLYYSTDYGITWNDSGLSDCFTSVDTDSTGKYAVVGATSTFPYIGLGYYTNNYGATWNATNYNPADRSYINDISMSPDGRYVIMTKVEAGPVYGIYSSNNFGIDYNLQSYGLVPAPYTVDISDGRYTYMGSNGGYLYKSVRDKRGLDTNSCEYTDDNGISWNPASWNGSACVYNNFTAIEGDIYTFNTRIKNWSGTFGYGTATTQYTTNVGSVIQFIVQNTLSTTLPNTDINIYTINPDNSRSILTTIRTDSTGSAYAILKNGTTYSLDIYYQGKFTATQQILISNITPIYVTINTAGSGFILPDTNNIMVTWTPSIDFIYTDVTSLVQRVTSNKVSDYNIKIYQYHDFNNTGIKTKYTAAAACPQNCTITTLLAGFSVDTNKPFYVDLNLGITGQSQRIIYTHKYVKPSSATVPPVQDLIKNARGDFSCSLDTSLPCGATIIISVILCILIMAAIVMLTGYAGPQGLGIIALAVLGIFTYVGWFYWIAYAIIILVTILYIGKGVVE